MIVKKQIRVDLDPPMLKIFCASVACNNTFVVARIAQIGQQHSIVHFDAKGKVLFQKKYQCVINSFGMLREDQVIVLNVSKNKIDIINLFTRKVMQVSHQYHIKNTDQMGIQTFFETKLFCIVQRDCSKDSSLLLTYYSYEGISQNTKPLTVWQSKKDQWTQDQSIGKLNNYSKIGWWKHSHKQELIFKYFDLKGKLSTVKAKIDPAHFYGVRRIWISIFRLWQTKLNSYMIVGNSNKSQFNNKFKTKGVFNNNYIVEETDKSDKATLRETKFVFSICSNGKILNDQINDCCGLGPISVFYTYNIKKFGFGLSPVNYSPENYSSIYYVLNETEEIVEIRKRKSSQSLLKLFFPGWHGAMVVQSDHTYCDCNQITFIITMVFFFSKDKILQMLLHLNEDFDDDLLGDAIEMLTQ